MLTRKHRFHGRTSLAYVYRRGSTIRAQHLALRYVRNTQRTDYRLAIIVSRKVHKSAVRRNRLRRRIYEIVRTGPAISEPYDLVITVFSELVSDMPPEQLTDAIRKLLNRAGVYHKPHPQSSSPRAIVES